jgi:hypothetical protein
MARRDISTQRPNTLPQTCLLARSFSLAVLRRTIHVGTKLLWLPSGEARCLRKKNRRLLSPDQHIKSRAIILFRLIDLNREMLRTIRGLNLRLQ